jgi:very-short-patch-repair endonuclease
MTPNPLCAFGHVATRRDLQLLGMSRHELDALLKVGDVVRPRKGIYACRHLEHAECIAVMVGARLDCVTVLKRHKIWVGYEKGLHLRMPPDAGGHAWQRMKAIVAYYSARGLQVLGSRSISTHSRRCAPPAASSRLEVTVLDALRQAMDCLPPDDLIAALESALHLKKITGSELDQLIIDAPERLQSALVAVTPGAQSGYETKARLKLQRAGHRVEIQVPVPGVGHVDTVIDGVVALEIDGRENHEETFEIDRDRDVGTEIWGLRGLRIPAVWVDTRWDYVLAALERMIADALRARAQTSVQRHRRRRRVRAAIFGDTPSAEQ